MAQKRSEPSEFFAGASNKGGLNMPKIIAMVLAGGRVGELDVLTYERPKSTVPFGGLYRIIDFPLSNLMNSGIERVGILSQYRSSSLIEHIGMGASWDMVGRHRGVSLLPPFHGLNASDWYRGTADAVYQNLDFIRLHAPDLVLILSGDHIYSMDYREVIAFHQAMQADVTAVFTFMSGDTSRFGQAIIAEDDPRGGRILQYAEKPVQSVSNWVSLTIFVFKTQVLEELIQANVTADSHEFGRDILPNLVGNYRFFGYKFHGYWAYSRTLEEYWNANMALLGVEPVIDLQRWGVRTNLEHEAIRDRPPAVVGPGAFMRNVRCYNGVRVEGMVENSILFPGVHIEKGAEVRDSILLFDSYVKSGAKLNRAITDIGVRIGMGCTVGAVEGGERSELAVIGMKAVLSDGVVVPAGGRVLPRAVVG